MRNPLAFRSKIEQKGDCEEAIDSTESHVMLDESKSVVSLHQH